MRKFLAALIVGVSLLTASVVHAEVKIYTGVGEYYMSDFETPNVAQQRAKQRAEQNACEQAGVFVKSFSRTKDFELVDDEVITMTSGILKIVDVQYHRENFDNNTTLIRATLKAQIDSNDVAKWLNKDSQERSTLIAQTEVLRKANAEQERQIAELKRRLADAKTPQDTELITQQFAAEDKIFLSNQKVDEAWKLYERGDYSGAAKLYAEAIELNPNNALAYYGRGTAFDDAGQYALAIQDYNNSVTLNPNFANVYYNRGNSYSHMNNYALAIQDYDKAVALNPHFLEAYVNRGFAYNSLGLYERAIQDFDMAIQLNPNLAISYNNRGYSYGCLFQYERAIADFDKAIELNPNYAEAFKNRGICYQQLGDAAKAQADFDKAKQLSGAKQ